MGPRVLLASEYNGWGEAFRSVSYDFCQVIAGIDDVHLIAPSLCKDPIERVFRKTANTLADMLERPRIPDLEKVHVEQDYDLFVFVCWTPANLVELSRIKHWRKRCRKTAVLINEVWANQIHQFDKYLHFLREFDYVFTPHVPTIPHLAPNTGGSCHFLAQGTDCLRATPFPLLPERVIDVYSYGHRPPEIHRQLIDLTERQEIFYQYDSLASSNSRVKSWSDHRLLLANNIKRSRYVLAFNPSANTLKASDAKGEQVLSARLFEGAAGGAAMIGSAPKCAEYGEFFDWEDAIIEISPDTVDLKGILKNLDADPARLDRVRQTNAIQSLRRNDWVYRWETVLKTVGLPASSKVDQRKARLWAIADTAERQLAFGGPARSFVRSAAE